MNKKKHQLQQKENKMNEKADYICESCNETFFHPEKRNKFLYICGLLGIYSVILFLVESIPTDDISLILPRFIMDVAFAIICIVHILVVLCKDSGRGKCPYCGSTDFISINSIKGKELLEKIEKEHKKAK